MSNKLTLSFFGALIILCSLNGCSSIVKGTLQDVNVSSVPAGAKVTVVDEANKVVYKGTTPATISIKKKAGYFKSKDYRVSLDKSGFEPSESEMNAGVTGWYLIGNAFVGGILGWVVIDPMTGGMWQYHDLEVNLVPVEK